MNNLEKILFDVNEGLHRTGLYPDDKYITQESVFISMILTAMLMLFMGNVIDDFVEKISANMNIISIVSGTLLVIYLLLNDGYMPLFIIMFIVGVLRIVYKYPQYSAMREYLERFF